jgi:DNA (cytosine-5)-methyltransferase 1
MILSVVDLFCGAGGLSKGFIDAGFKVILGIDNDEAALKTFKENHDSATTLMVDLSKPENVNKIKEKIEEIKETVDVLVGGPPCQGFSLAGKREEKDDRNILYKAMVKTSNILKPKIIVLENVPGLLTLYNGKAAERIFKDFEDIGYEMQAKILYAPNFGVPQIRKRVFFIGVRKNLKLKNNFRFPEFTLNDKDSFITAEDALSDLPSLENDDDFSLDKTRTYLKNPSSEYQKIMRKNSKLIYNHYPIKHKLKTIKTISLVPDGGNYRDLPKELSKNFKYKESMKRYNSKKPSLTVDTGHRTHFHYKHNRIPTVRECARLQSFPDDFIFYGSKQQQYRQVGNAVPPMLGKHIALKIKELLQDERKI